MIVSASYRTDIPAFYPDWFANRLREGFCRVTNPYNRSQQSRVSLTKGDVDGFVFWTKNCAPFMSNLEAVSALEIPFVVQYTINGYPRQLESRVVDARLSVQTFRSIAARYGNRTIVWRYDTIILSSLTDKDFHLWNFRNLAAALEGATDEVTVSFVQLYQKTLRNFREAARRESFVFSEPSDEEKRGLLLEFVDIAWQYGMQLTVCSQPELIVEGAQPAHCIDAHRLEALGGKPIKAAVKGNRPGCECYLSRDIGNYDTCPHGCVYCYAVQNRELALDRFRKHDPTDEYLFEPDGPADPQLELFGSE